MTKAMEETRRRANCAIREQVGRANLTAERERQLLRIIKTSADEAARQSALTELWESHSKLVVAIARRYRHASADLLDLVGAGHLGLHAAISRFDPDRFESRLSSYAIGWIRWHIQDYMRRNLGPVRLPSSAPHRQLSQMSGRLFADARRSCARARVEPTESELCARIGRRIGMHEDEVARSMCLIQGGTLSLHADTADNSRGLKLMDILADDGDSPEDSVILRLDHAKARKRIMVLSQEILGERERAVFLARCMTGNDEIPHLDSLAKSFGVSRERVYQLEASAKQKIATALAQEGYNDFVHDGHAFRAPPTRARRRRIPALPLRKGMAPAQSAARS